LVSEHNTLAAIELLETFSPNVYETSDFYRLLAGDASFSGGRLADWLGIACDVASGHELAPDEYELSRG